MNDKIYHIPVLLKHLVGSFQLKKDAVIIDGTLGFAGHASEILKNYPNIRYIGFDKDIEAIKISTHRMKLFPNTSIINAPFSSMFDVIKDKGIKPTHILLDLGVSSFQIDDSNRGFTFQKDEPLDMRMDVSNQHTAKDVLNEYSEDDLMMLFMNEADLKAPKTLVDEIIEYRNQRSFLTTFDLLSCIKRGVRTKSRRHYIAMATKIFQAIRIEVNNEMKELDQFLNGILDLNDVIIAIITFQPNEDKKVKQFIKENNLHRLTKKPIQSSYHECKKILEKKTAKLRIFKV